MTKIHLDTGLGGDMDDLCALAMLGTATGNRETGGGSGDGPQVAG